MKNLQAPRRTVGLAPSSNSLLNNTQHANDNHFGVKSSSYKTNAHPPMLLKKLPSNYHMPDGTIKSVYFHNQHYNNQ